MLRGASWRFARKNTTWQSRSLTCQRQVAAGMVAEVEITRAESGVADTVQSIITAQNTLRQNQRNLKRIVHRPDLPLEGATIVVPSTTPNATPYALDPDELTHKSMHERMELLETELQIATDTANIDAARNATLPLLALNYSYGLNGLGPEYPAAFAETRDKRFETNTAGLHLEIPIGNEAARARLARRWRRGCKPWRPNSNRRRKSPRTSTTPSTRSTRPGTASWPPKSARS